MARQELKYLFLDVETTGLDEIQDRLYSLGVAEVEDEVMVYPADQIPDDVRAKLADPSYIKVGHNTRFDLRFLHHAGFKIDGPIYDTMLMARLIEQNELLSLGLKELITRHLGKEHLSSKRRLDKACAEAGVRHVGALTARDLELPSRPYFDVIAQYNREDVNNTLKLFYVLRERLQELHRWVKKEGLGGAEGKTPATYYVEELVPVESVLFKMECEGVTVDPAIFEEIHEKALADQEATLARLNARYAKPISEIEEDLYQEALSLRKSERGKAGVQRGSEKYKTKFKWSSGPHLGRLIYEKLGAPEARTDKGAYDTKESTLKRLARDFPPITQLFPLYQRWKKLQKVIRTYTGDSKKGIVSKIRPGNKIYGKFTQLPRTGRLSARDPNFQNLKKDAAIKQAFIPSSPESVFGYGDYSQIELRITAELSGDKNLIAGYCEAGNDVHKQTAAAMFQVPFAKVTDDQRQAGKTTNFLLVFNGSPYRLYQELVEKNGLPYTYEDCKAFHERFFNLYPNLHAYFEQQIAAAKRDGFVIARNGRVRWLPDFKYGDYLDHKRKVFHGPLNMVIPLLETPKELELIKKHGRWDGEDIYWAARRRWKSAINQSLNTPVQGLAATIMRRGLLGLAAAGFKIRTTIHDSYITELNKATAQERVLEMKSILEGAYKLAVPLKVDPKLLTTFDEKSIWQPELHLQHLVCDNDNTTQTLAQAQ